MPSPLAPPTPDTVDAYIAGFPPDLRARLASVRATILRAVPQGEERISYRMPAVFRSGVVLYYAAFQRHIGVYPPVHDPALRAQVAPYAGPKGNLQFPHAEPIPYALIAAVASSRLRANLAKATARPARAAQAVRATTPRRKRP